jgi:branched-chain amino acid transport system substrate-binding protein
MGYLFQYPMRRFRRARWGISWLLLASWGGLMNSRADLGPSAPLAEPVTPYRNLRQTTLEYRGPEEDVADPGEIRIAWFGPTGASNVLGADMWWAANFAVGEANARTQAASPHGPASSADGPAPLLCRLVPCWAADPWGAGVSQLARMVYEERPLAVVGSIDSASTHLAEQIVAKANLPLVSPIATDKSITLAGVSWTFACAPSDSAVAAVLVDGILSTLENRNRRVALLATTDHESRMTTREVLREFTRRQHPPDFRFDVPPGAQESSQQLAALAEAGPAVVLIIAGAEDSARLTQAVRRACKPGQGSDSDRGPRLFGCQSMARTQFRELAGPVGEEVCFPLVGVASLTNSTAAVFVQRFTTERGHPPDYASLLAYDATQLLLEAIRQAGPHRARVRNALSSLSPWPGIAGAISFDGTGQNIRTNVLLGTWRGGQIQLINARLGPAKRLFGGIGPSSDLACINYPTSNKLRTVCVSSYE